MIFLVWLWTGSNAVDINRFPGHTEKKNILNNKAFLFPMSKIEILKKWYVRLHVSLSPKDINLSNTQQKTNPLIAQHLSRSLICIALQVNKFSLL